MNTSNRKQLIQILSKSAIFAIAIATIAGQAWAEKPQPSAATLTLLSEINEVLANTEDSEGLSQETLAQLAESVLWTTEPEVVLASSEPAILSSYPGAKLSNVTGEIAYIAINTSAEATVVSFTDSYSMNVPADGFAIRLQNFGHTFSILEFGGEIIVDGNDFFIATSGAAIELPYVEDSRTYSFSDDGMRITSQDIFVSGALEIMGTASDDTFDFSGLNTPLERSIYIDGRDGTDSILTPNFDTTIYFGVTKDNISNSGLGFYIENIERIVGGEGQNTLHVANIENTWQISDTDSGTIQTSSGSEVSFQNFNNLVGDSEVDTFSISNNGVISETLSGDSNITIEGNAVNLSSPHFDSSIQITDSSSLVVGDISFTPDNFSIINGGNETTLSGTTNIVITQQDEAGTIEAHPVSIGTITNAIFELTTTSTNDEEATSVEDATTEDSSHEEPTTSVEDTTTEDSSEAEFSNEKSSTNDESGGGSFNLFSLLILSFLSFAHTRKTKKWKAGLSIFSNLYKRTPSINK